MSQQISGYARFDEKTKCYFVEYVHPQQGTVCELPITQKVWNEYYAKVSARLNGRVINGFCGSSLYNFKTTELFRKVHLAKIKQLMVEARKKEGYGHPMREVRVWRQLQNV